MRTGRRGAEDELQRQLRDLLCLAVVGDHLRWVVTDDGNGDLADWLTRASGSWRDWADQVASQLRISGVAPDGRVRSLAEDIPLNWVPDGWLAADARAPTARRAAAGRLRLGPLPALANERRARRAARRHLLGLRCATASSTRPVAPVSAAR
jgi:hypothetical protein